MSNKCRAALKAALSAFVFAFALPLVIVAQGQGAAQPQASPAATTATNFIPSRITQAVNETNLTMLRGNTHPLAQARFDQGAAPDGQPMRRMLLVLKRSTDQEATLDALLDQQQDSTSPNFHKWLTPQQFGQQFGPSDQDVQTITSWLQSHGFTVASVSSGRTVIEFSGTAGQVRDAFHTEIHRYTMNGQDHWANSSDPQIPAALAPVVAGINTLYNFPRQAMHHLSGAVTRSTDTNQYKLTTPLNPLFNASGTCGVQGSGCHWLSPYDFATIYNVLPLWTAASPIDGTGQTIAIVGESDVSLSDITSFRSYFDLPANNVKVIVDGEDPGTVPDDETESDLDLEWSGAVAKGATIDFVTSQTTETTLGVDLSAQYIVDGNLAPILSESYGVCELFLGNAANQFYNQLWQQASAEGITALVSAGDSGSAVCDRNSGNTGAALSGLSVSGISSTPFNVAVGGTDFFDLTNFSTFWSPANKAPTTGAIASESALSYIPETTWNDSCTNAVFGTLLGFSTNAETNCNNPELSDFLVAAGGSGGMSNCITSTGLGPYDCTDGYPKPPWQTSLTPADGARDVPDISLYAAAGSPSGSAYILCAADQLPTGYTSCDSADPNTEFLGIGGTSASAPAFAGMMALVDQATGSRQGNANYVLYKLAAATGASCNSTGTLNSNCVFYDTTNGTIAMPCHIDSPDEPGPDPSICPIQLQTDSFGVLSGYSTAAGYDLATGLGSVNAANLISKWKAFNSSLVSSTTSVQLSAATSLSGLTHGESVQATVNVTGSGSTPTGTVSLMASVGSGPAEIVASAVLANGSATFSTDNLPGGTYSAFAQYSGDSTFTSSQSSPTSISVGPEASATNVVIKLFDPSSGVPITPTPSSINYGYFYAIARLNVTSSAADACPTNAPGPGCPTGTLTLANTTSSGAAPMDGGSFTLNSSGYTEDQGATLAMGTNLIQASYPGDASYSPSTGSAAITVNKTGAAVFIYPPLTAGFEDPCTISIVVDASGNGAAPTGQVTLFAGSTQIGQPVVLPNGVAGTLDGQPASTVSIVTSQLPLGTTTLTAQYTGDSHYFAYPSAPQTIATKYLTTAAVASSSATIQVGSSVTFTATITPEHSGGPPMGGTVTFLDFGGTMLGSPVPVVNGQAQFSATSLSAGNHAISAAYSGDPNYASATGVLTGGETVSLLSTTMTLTTSAAFPAVGQSVTLTATVSPTVSGGPAVTGYVGFDACSTTGTNNCLYPIGSVPLSNGQAQVTTTIIPGGTIEVLADYTGDSNYSGSLATTAETVGPSFSISASPAALTISAPGQSASTLLTFTSANGLTGTGTLLSSTCGVALSEEIACSLSSFSLPANGTATATLTLTSTAASGSAPGGRIRPQSVPPLRVWLSLSYLLAAVGVFLAVAYGKERRRRVACAAILLAALAACASCGGGSSGSSGGGGGITNPGTPTGPVAGLSISVAIGGTSRTVPNLTLTVN